jgi:amylosucrase
VASTAATRTGAVRTNVDALLGEGIGADERRRFWNRVERATPVLRALLAALYPQHDLDALVQHLLRVTAAAVRDRAPDLRALDLDRSLDPAWFQTATQVGYVAYVDRYAGTLCGVREHIDHLVSLHVTYLHLMHVLRARTGPNDGGYAVVDYGDVEPSLGSRDDLAALAADLRGHGISLCLDVVLNHTAREHPWATAARAGSERHRAYYLTFTDHDQVLAHERTLPEVFPQIAPGNFTFDDDLQAWVWTTFHDFQWDLDHRNPDVFSEMLGVMLDLANLGVDVLRLDAIAFTWKRLGTSCQNQPEVHLLAQAYRAFLGIAAPGVLLQAEAIVGPADLLPYLGAHRTQRAECHLAYHNQLMVDIWDALATGDATLATAALASLPPTPPDAAWVTYLRCHDDIGWAIDDSVAASVQMDGAAHRRHLAAFFRGDAPGSTADGAPFSTNHAADDERTCGSAAALCGLSRARAAGDAHGIERGVQRLLLGYSVVFGFGGIPLVYMGDEVALGNDTSYLSDALLSDDSRWMHRPFMDWSAVRNATEQSQSVEGNVLTGLRHLAAVRRATPALGSGGETWVHRLASPSVLAWARRHPHHGRFYGLANFAEHDVSLPVAVLGWAGLDEPVEVLGNGVRVTADAVLMPALSTAWFVDRRDDGVQPPAARTANPPPHPPPDPKVPR